MTKNDKLRLQGKVAIVTGACQGLGFGISRAFLEAGATVVLTDINTNVSSSAQSLDSIGTASSYVLDVRNEAAFAACVDDTASRYGKVDIFVNNAALTISKSVWDIPADEWDDVLAVNLRGVFFGCRVAGKFMRDQRRGRIVNISSLAGQRGGVVAGAHYSASKAGILVLTKCFAQELAGYGVTVNSIAPAAIDGPIVSLMPTDKVEGLKKTIPVRRLGTADDVARIALFLASDLSSYVSGAVIPADGGLAVYR